MKIKDDDDEWSELVAVADNVQRATFRCTFSMIKIFGGKGIVFDTEMFYLSSYVSIQFIFNKRLLYLLLQEFFGS